MGESNTVVSAYTMHRHLQQYCSHQSIYIYNQTNFLAGMDDVTDCRQCEGGYYCHMQGATGYDPAKNISETGVGICSAGYYCKSGNSDLLLCNDWNIYQTISKN